MNFRQFYPFFFHNSTKDKSFPGIIKNKSATLCILPGKFTNEKRCWLRNFLSVLLSTRGSNEVSWVCVTQLNSTYLYTFAFVKRCVMCDTRLFFDTVDECGYSQNIEKCFVPVNNCYEWAWKSSSIRATDKLRARFFVEST